MQTSSAALRVEHRGDHGPLVPRRLPGRAARRRVHRHGRRTRGRTSGATAHRRQRGAARHRTARHRFGPGPAPQHPDHRRLDAGSGRLRASRVLAQHGFDADVHDAHISGWGLLDVIDGASALDVLGREPPAHPDVDTVSSSSSACARSLAPRCPTARSSSTTRGMPPPVHVVTSASARGLQVLWAVSPPAPALTADPPVEDWFSFPMRSPGGDALVADDRADGDRFGIATTDGARRSPTRAAVAVAALVRRRGAWRSPRRRNPPHRRRLRRTSSWTVAALLQVWSRPQGESVL